MELVYKEKAYSRGAYTVFPGDLLKTADSSVHLILQLYNQGGGYINYEILNVMHIVPVG